MNPRRALTAKIKIGCNQLGLNDPDKRDEYEGMLFGVTGKRSSTEMDFKQLHMVINHLEKCGAAFTKKGNKRKHKRAKNPQVRMIFGLWAELHELGGVKDVSRGALISWVRKMTKSDEQPNGCDDPDWLTPAQSQQLVESLKQWIARIS